MVLSVFDQILIFFLLTLLHYEQSIIQKCFAIPESYTFRNFKQGDIN